MRVDASARRARQALLTTLGCMAPEERKTRAPQINVAKDAVTRPSPRAEKLRGAALDARLESERLDVTLPARGAANRAASIRSAR